MSKSEILMNLVLIKQRINPFRIVVNVSSVVNVLLYKSRCICIYLGRKLKHSETIKGIPG
jgi:hypothetical protein